MHGRSVRGILWVALMVFTFLGCTKGPEPSGEARIVVFSYDYGGDLKDQILDELIGRFEKQNPDIKVRKHSTPGVTDVARSFYLESMRAQSTFVDVFEADTIWISEMAAGELLLPLDDKVSSEQRAAWIPAAVEQVTYDGKLYAVPYYVTYGGLFYRKSLLEKYGFQPPKTWEEFDAQARKIAEAEGIDGFVWQGRQYEGLVVNALQFYVNMGGEVRVVDGRVTFDQGTLEKTLAFLQGLIHEAKLSPDAVLDHVGEDSESLFAQGDAAFMINTQAAARYIPEGKIKDDFGIAPLPGKGVSVTGGFQLAINKRSTNPTAAVKFALFMASEASQKLLLERRGQGPALRALYQGDDAFVSALRTLSAHTATRPKSPRYHEFSLMFAEEVYKVLDKVQTPAEGAKRIVERAKNQDFPKVATPEFPKTMLKWEL